MYCDFVLMKIDSDVESFANKLGFSKLYFLSDFDKLGLFESKDYDTNRKLVESKKINSLVNPVMFGRVKQNIKLCRKYKVKILFFTFAKSKYELKGLQDLLSLLRVLGMNGIEAKSA